MKPILLLTLVLCSLQASLAVTPAGYQHGMVVKMRMGDCALVRRGFMTTFGPPQAPAEAPCPEYTLVTDKVVFVIVGKSSRDLVPLAEVVDFRFHKNALAMRVDDERRESKFVIKEMTLRSQWDLVQRHIENALKNSSREPDDPDLAGTDRE
jgi:hypothetical protein